MTCSESHSQKGEWRLETRASDSQPMLSFGLFAKYPRTFGVPATCLVAQTSNSARTNQMVLETDINHMTTLSSFIRGGRKEHYGSSLCLSPMPEDKTSAFAGAGVAQVTAWWAHHG